MYSLQLTSLQISERTDSHLENLHRGLTLWDRVVQLGVEVESWTASKLEVFARSPSFQSEDDIKRLQVKPGSFSSLSNRYFQTSLGVSYGKLTDLQVSTVALTNDELPLTFPRTRLGPRRGAWSDSNGWPPIFSRCFKAKSPLWSYRCSA